MKLAEADGGATVPLAIAPKSGLYQAVLGIELIPQSDAASQLIRILGTQRSVSIIPRPYAAVAEEIRESAHGTPRGTRETAIEIFRVTDKPVTLSVEDSIATPPPVKESAKPAAAPRAATKPGSYDIKPGLTLVIANDDGAASVGARLIWQAQGQPPSSASQNIPLSNGMPYAVVWREGGDVLWVSCGSKEGSADGKVMSYLRTVIIRGPANIDDKPDQVELPANADAADQEAF